MSNRWRVKSPGEFEIVRIPSMSGYNNLTGRPIWYKSAISHQVLNQTASGSLALYDGETLLYEVRAPLVVMCNVETGDLTILAQAEFDETYELATMNPPTISQPPYYPPGVRSVNAVGPEIDLEGSVARGKISTTDALDLIQGAAQQPDAQLLNEMLNKPLIDGD